MSIVLSATLALAASAVPSAQDAPSRVLQIRAAVVWTGAGERLENALVRIENGQVRSVSAGGELDPKWPSRVHDGVLTAGLIACGTESGAAGQLLDETRTVMPEARAAHAFQPEHGDFERLLQAGITSVVLAPGDEDLVAGLSCVVKTAGGRVLEPRAALALSFSGTALGRSIAQGSSFFGQAQGFAGATQGEGGPEDSGRTRRGTREPTSYAGALDVLGRLFASGAEPYAAARRGELPVLLSASQRHEVLRAVEFAKAQGLSGALRGAPLAGDPDLVEALKGSGLGVILPPTSAGQATRSLRNLAVLSAAGVPVAFELEAPRHAPIELRLDAARALAAGASREAAFRALTEDAARLAGVGERIGALSAGRDADLVLWSGDPLDLSSRVLAVYVDGELSWSAPEPQASAPRARDQR